MTAPTKRTLSSQTEGGEVAQVRVNGGDDRAQCRSVRLSTTLQTASGLVATVRRRAVTARNSL